MFFTISRPSTSTPKPQDSPPSSPDTPIAPAPRRATACCI
jgi:hypothetical protein